MGHTTGVTIRLHNHKHIHLSMVNTRSCYVMNHPKNLVISNKQKLKDLTILILLLNYNMPGLIQQNAFNNQ